MIAPKIGLVIPIIQKKYISNLIRGIYKTVNRKDFVLCVVNDGNIRIRKYLRQIIPDNVHLLNLSKNLCFAGANNAGWELLTQKYPSLEFLGSINDDAVPYECWLDFLTENLERNSTLGVCAPVMLSDGNPRKMSCRHSSTWKLYNSKRPMIADVDKIDRDQYVSVIGGFCFIARKKALVQVGFFDDRFKNSCEDIDLSLKLTANGWKLMVCHNSFVHHDGGMSRFKLKAKTKIRASRELLRVKWGEDLTKYNLK